MEIIPLNEKIWRAFLVGELFVTIRNGLQVPTGAHVSKENLREGKTPRITVTANNNGVYGFYSSTDKNYKTYENFISVSFLGDCFYHPYEASLDMKVHCLKLLRRELTAPLALFLTRMLKQMTAVFNYGNQISSTDIVNKKIFLPVNENGAPDFEYMENYTRAVEEKLLQRYRAYAEEKFSALETKKIPPLNEKIWRAFLIEEIFDIFPGKRLTKSDMVAGDVPFVSAADSNNGVTAFVGNENDSADENVLGVNYDGNGMVISFYHPYRCIFSDSVKRFHLKNRAGNKYVYLFLKTVILQQKEKFNYGYKFNEARMRRQKIFLPVNDEGAPDFEYMEAYAKNLEAEKYRKYLEHLNQKDEP